jgi:hypothetical protein
MAKISSSNSRIWSATPAAIADVTRNVRWIRQKLQNITCSATAAARFSSFFEKPIDSRVSFDQYANDCLFLIVFQSVHREALS